VAVVYHPSSPVPFSRPIGGVETGHNLALAAARVAEGPPEAVIGGQAVRNLLAGIGLEKIGVDRLMGAVNVAGGKIRGGDQFGPLGAYLKKALDGLGITPPPLTETRPALASVEAVLGEPSKLKELLGMARSSVLTLGIEDGLDIEPLNQPVGRAQ
jgi:hypothetical protein